MRDLAGAIGIMVSMTPLPPLPPPPRRVRRPLTVGRTFGWVLLLSFVVATVGAELALLNELAYRFLGRDISAAVTSLHEHPDGDGGYRRVANYTFAPAPGHAPRSDSARIDHQLFRELQKPFMTDTIPDEMTFPLDKPGALAVRVYTLGPIVCRDDHGPASGSGR